MEETVTRETLYDINHLAPSGFDFSAKKLTEKAKKKLKGYWLCTVNLNEKCQEMVDDREAGHEITSFDWKWKGNYQASVNNCFTYLRNNKFIKIKK